MQPGHKTGSHSGVEELLKHCEAAAILDAVV
jgi:hypothetical protein